MTYGAGRWEGRSEGVGDGAAVGAGEGPAEGRRVSAAEEGTGLGAGLEEYWHAQWPLAPFATSFHLPPSPRPPLLLAAMLVVVEPMRAAKGSPLRALSGCPSAQFSYSATAPPQLPTSSFHAKLPASTALGSGEAPEAKERLRVMPRYTLRPLPTPLTMRVTKALVTLSPTQTIDAPERPAHLDYQN